MKKINMAVIGCGERGIGVTKKFLAMAHGKAGMAWITVQTHMNVIAVASLMEMAAVIIPEDIEMEEASLEKAREEGICVLQSSRTAYELCAMMAQAGLPGTPREG